MASLLTTRHAGVLQITFNRPERRNALDLEMRGELAAAIAEVRGDASIRALLLCGAGGAFCSGGDLRNIGSSTLDSEGWRLRMRESHQWLRELLSLDRPVIAAVEGAAYGAGFSLALAADFILAAPSARFCMSFAKIGGVPDLGALYSLPRVVGVQRARELMLSAREVGAEEAQRLGIVFETHPAEQLIPAALALAERFVGASPTTCSLVKRGLEMAPSASLEAMLDFEAAAQAIAFSTDYHRAAVSRFIDKQPAQFQWPARPSEAPAPRAASQEGVSHE